MNKAGGLADMRNSVRSCKVMGVNWVRIDFFFEPGEVTGILDLIEFILLTKNDQYNSQSSAEEGEIAVGRVMSSQLCFGIQKKSGLMSHWHRYQNPFNNNADMIENDRRKKFRNLWKSWHFILTVDYKTNVWIMSCLQLKRFLSATAIPPPWLVLL